MNTKTYKQAFIVIAISIFIVPQIAFAAWWNPLSWFSGWSFFHKTDTQTQVLENRVKELEKKLEGVATSTSATETTTKSPQTKTTVKSIQTTQVIARKNYNSTPLAAADFTIRRINGDIEYTQSIVSYLNETVENTIERKDFVNNSNIYNDAGFNLLVKADEESIKRYQEYISYFNALIDIMRTNLSNVQQGKKTINSNFYESEEAAKQDALFMLSEGDNESKIVDTLTKVNEDLDKFHNKYEADYKNALLILKSYNEANRPASNVFIPTPVYISPQVQYVQMPQQQIFQMPQTTRCTISGDGVGLQAYVNCSTGSF